jgi:hypothetical protein
MHAFCQGQIVSQSSNNSTRVPRHELGQINDVRVIVLPVKPSHHGSRTSSREPFVRAVDPSMAVFSVQRDSRFGHPHPMIVERYKALGVHFLRTDEHGAISVHTDGQSVWVAPYMGEPALVSTPVTHRITKTLVRPPAEPR